MYRFFDENGNTIGYAESVRYIRLNDNGCYIETDADNAEGVAINSTAYSLAGKTLKGAAGTAGVAEIDGAALIAEQDAVLNELLAASLEG